MPSVSTRPPGTSAAVETIPTASPAARPATSHATSGHVFAFLWAGAHVLHAWHKGGTDLGRAMSDPWLILVLLAGFAVIARPASPHRLAVLAGAQIVAFAVEIPFVANHWTISAFVNAGILASYLAWRRSAARVAAPLASEFAPYARVVFLVAYGAAALSKLNTTFLDPAYSCAVGLIEPIGLWLGFGAPSEVWIRTVIVWTVLLVELSVPALLFLRPTRLYGIALAAVFHLFLGATPVVLVMDFTALILALVFLFAPADIGDRMAREGQDFARRWAPVMEHARRIWTPGKYVLIGSLLVLALGRGRLLDEEVWVLLTWAVLLLYGAVAVFVGLAVLASYRGERDRIREIGSGRGLLPAQALLVGLLLCNAASPYLGLKTTSSFTMFSNLRTEAGATNHLLFPRLALFGYQDDIVRVLESSNPVLAGYAGSDQRLTYHELRRVLSGDPGASVTFARGADVRALASAAQVPELVTLTPVERKLLHFRSVTASGNPICQP